MEVVLENLVPRILPNADFRVHTYNGKGGLLKKLPSRLKAYGKWLPDNYKLIVLVDRDADDCIVLKGQLEQISDDAGLKSISNFPKQFQIINRIVIEELEAWFFGDFAAIRDAYPRVPARLERSTFCRYPDLISDGTSEQLASILGKSGYHPVRLMKLQAARDISRHMDPDRNRSKSFQVFRDALKMIPHIAQDEQV